MTSAFLDMQAYVGITKHIGGIPATRTLLDLCHVDDAQEVLDVGCGIGAGLVRIVQAHDCSVVGVDRSEQMLEWSRRRAREARAGDRVELVQADVLDLPFAADRFDAVFCESVLAFVADKERAVREMIRVTRPGGFVGLNEAFLLDESPSPTVVALGRSMGTEMIGFGAWRHIWAATGLEERVVRAYRIDPAREVRGRIRWIGLGWMVRGWARALALYATHPELRGAIRVQLGAATGTDDADEAGAAAAWASFGYGLFVGRKPAA